MNKTLTVKQINNYISGVFDDEIILHDISVTGEIFEFRISQNNTFIILKEDDNVLECYRYGKLERFEKGAKVTVRGSIKFYSRSGRISLTVSEIKYSGEGAYHLEFLKLKERLKNEGYFDNKNKLPLFVKKVALITSIEGAVLHDFMSVINKEYSCLEVEVHNVSVQGSYSKDDITGAVAKINSSSNADVIVIARGGGSYQDLLPFNSEEVARAVFNSRIPVISAVGHETDYTLCDFCSVFRAPTPSIAAETIERINKLWLDRVYYLLTRAAELLSTKLFHLGNYVSLLTRKLSHCNELSIANMQNKIISTLREIEYKLSSRLALCKAALENKTTKLDASIQNKLKNSENKFFTLNTKLDSLSPLKLMASGYAKVISKSKVIKSVEEVHLDSELKIAFFDGVATAKVFDIAKNKEN